MIKITLFKQNFSNPSDSGKKEWTLYQVIMCQGASKMYILF